MTNLEKVQDLEWRKAEAEIALTMAKTRQINAEARRFEHESLVAGMAEQLSTAKRQVKLLIKEGDCLRDEIVDFRNEIDCRIEHGAESGGHLDYVKSRLNEIIGRAPF